MVSPAVSEYVLAVPNVRVRWTLWTIKRMQTAPLPSMVVTGVPLSLSDDDVKEGLIAGSWRALPVPEQNELWRIEVHCLFLHSREQGMPPGGNQVPKHERLAKQQPVVTQAPSQTRDQRDQYAFLFR